MTNPITFTAAVSKGYTLVDGGLRVTFDLPETAIMQFAEMIECKRLGMALQVTCVPVEKAQPTVYGGRLKDE